MTDWQERLIEERSALTTKMLKLVAFINHPDHGDLARLEQELLAQQLQIMSAYQLILASRIKLYQMDNKT
ncbi:MAG: hypothetical protein KAY71_00470 [Chromatiaceae bacterium]|nr:hypothetical protein [Chromatiaceae bacterium]MBP9602637.1 hypothetical protein [Chromatiaceae bacterium]